MARRAAAGGCAMPEEAWSESGDLPEGIVLSLRAVDQDAVDAAEMRDFVERVHTPAEEGNTRPKGGVTSAALSGVIFAGWFALAFGGPWAALGVLGAAGVAAGANASAKALRRRRDAQAAAPCQYELVVSSEVFEVRREGTVSFSRSLDEVHGFTGGRRLHLHAPDGTSTRLGLSVPSRDHTALAARLTELVTRARVARRGYR